MRYVTVVCIAVTMVASLCHVVLNASIVKLNETNRKMMTRFVRREKCDRRRVRFHHRTHGLFVVTERYECICQQTPLHQRKNKFVDLFKVVTRWLMFFCPMLFLFCLENKQNGRFAKKERKESQEWQSHRNGWLSLDLITHLIIIAKEENVFRSPMFLVVHGCCFVSIYNIR